MLYILPRSNIVSDCGGLCWNQKYNDGIYSHDVIVHHEHFGDLNDVIIHTKNVNIWVRITRKQFSTFESTLTNSYGFNDIRRERGFQPKTSYAQRSLWWPFLNFVVLFILRVKGN